MNATNRTYNGMRHAEFMAISSILSEVSESETKSEPVLSNPSGVKQAGDGREGVIRKRRYGPDVLRECDLYVTVEPCIMCASLLRQIGVRKVFFGASNEKFGGTGGVLNVHRGNGRRIGDCKPGNDVGVVGSEGFEVGKGESGGEGETEEGDYEVSGGWLRNEAVLMLQRFYMQENERAPEPKARGKKGVLAGVEVGVGGDGRRVDEGKRR
jgi:tRNA-specific adenosine deaminase 2